MVFTALFIGGALQPDHSFFTIIINITDITYVRSSLYASHIYYMMIQSTTFRSRTFELIEKVLDQNSRTPTKQNTYLKERVCVYIYSRGSICSWRNCTIKGSFYASFIPVLCYHCKLGQ